MGNTRARSWIKPTARVLSRLILFLLLLLLLLLHHLGFPSFAPSSQDGLHLHSTPSSRRLLLEAPVFLFFCPTNPTNQQSSCLPRHRAKRLLPTPWRPSARRCSK